MTRRRRARTQERVWGKRMKPSQAKWMGNRSHDASKYREREREKHSYQLLQDFFSVYRQQGKKTYQQNKDAYFTAKRQMIQKRP